MVPHLQDVRAQPFARDAEEVRLLLALRVSHEQHGATPVRQPEDEAVVVRPVGRVGSRAWREDLEKNGTECVYSTQIFRMPHADAARAHRAEELRVASALPFALSLTGVPQLVHRDAVEPVDQAAIMIRMRVREDDGTQPLDPLRPQHRADHARPHVDGAPDEPSAVDEQGLSVRQLDQRRVSLPHIQVRDAELVRMWPPCPRLCEHQRGDGHGEHEARWHATKTHHDHERTRRDDRELRMRGRRKRQRCSRRVGRHDRDALERE